MKTKKLLAFLLALVMSLGLALPALAEEDGDDSAATREPDRPTLSDGYYLIGINGWTLDSIGAADQLEQNPGNANEYWIKTTVAVGDQFKVVQIVNGEFGNNGYMFGSGDGNGNYVITDGTPSGSVSVYFQTSWNNSWNGYLYVAQNYDLTIAATTCGTVTASPARNISVGETVTLTVEPEAGCELVSLLVDNADVTANVENNAYSFGMPAHDTAVSAAFRVSLPKASITEITGDNMDTYIPEYDLDKQLTGNVVDHLDAEYLFTLDESTTSAQIAEYKNWHCDYRVSFDGELAAESFGLFGAYDYQGSMPLSAAFKFPYDVDATTSLRLLESVGLDDGLLFKDVVNSVGAFKCGVFNLSDDNRGRTMTVELLLWGPDQDVDEAEVIATRTYYFGDLSAIVPPLPTATATPITPAATVTVNGESVTLEAEYKFTPDAPTQDQLRYYGGWYADYRVTMNQDTEADSFGLYGEYDGYGQHFTRGFLFPNAMTAGESVMLLELAGVTDHVTYNDVVNNIGEFYCGVFNKSADNIDDLFKVELVIWDPAAPETVCVIATQDYTFKEMYTVTTTSRDTAGNACIATLTGGGLYEVGKEVTVTANPVGNYTFVGWYEGSYTSDNQRSSAYTYKFTVTKDVDLIAVYQSNAATGKLHVIGSAYKVNEGELQTSSNDFDIAIGAKTRVAAYIHEDYLGEGDFLYWVNIAGNVVSTSPNYPFTMVGETTLRLVTAKNSQQGESVYVVFLNAYNQVISQGRAIDAEEVRQIFPNINPSKMGAKFVKWVFKGTEDEATADTIFAKASATENVVVTVVPLYDTTDAGAYTLNVMYKIGDVTENYTTFSEITGGSPKTVTVEEVAAAAELTAETFSYWSLDGGTTPVSYDSTSYTVIGFKDQTIDLVAVFGSETEAEPMVSIDRMWSETDDGKYKIKTMMSWFVPDGCTVEKCGFVFTLNEAYSSDEALKLDTGVSAVKVHPTGMTTPNGIYTFNGSISDPSRTLYIRAFVSYTDSEGAVHTIYSDIRSGSYNSLQNQ